MRQLKYLTNECLEQLRSYILDEEQSSLLMKMAELFNSSNARIKPRRITSDDIAACINTLLNYKQFRSKGKGHWYCIYRVLIEDDYIPQMKVSDFRRYMQTILKRNDRIFSDSIMTKCSATELRNPVDEWPYKVQSDNLMSYVMLAEKFRQILDDFSVGIFTNKDNELAE